MEIKERNKIGGKLYVNVLVFCFQNFNLFSFPAKVLRSFVKLCFFPSSSYYFNHKFLGATKFLRSRTNTNFLWNADSLNVFFAPSPCPLIGL